MAESEPGLMAQILGRVAYEFAQMQPMLPVYLHLIASALFPIYTGAHASLSRPSSAAKPPKKKREGEDDPAEDDEDEEEERLMEGLSPTDALLMPLFAGCALASLYFLLEWMKDAALLNKLLNGYFAIFGVFSVSRLITDVLDIGHSIIFPHRYALGGALYHVKAKDEKAVPVAGNTKDKRAIATPLPGFLAKMPITEGMRRMLWADRAMPGNKWTLRMYLHRMGAGKFKIGPHGIVGLLAGLTTVAYFNLVDKPWYLTNLLGFGFSYGALQLMSPTTFATGSLILGALFFYDIYFVFYTPMMVTVAKSLDVPIKLMFPRPPSPNETSTTPSHAMLGLGDVVLPGIMIGLALRFDLYLFYLRRQKRIPASKEGESEVVEKPQYHSLAGRWSDRFWTHSLMGRPLWPAGDAEGSKPEPPFTFSKIYFTASLIGYVLGLLATLGVMMVWNHAQPALLYLVPGVLGSLWLTALARGELSLMWDYTEDIGGEEDKLKKNSDGEKGATGDKDKDAAKENSSSKTDDEDGQSEKVKRLSSHHPEREVFSFSIEAPWKLKQPRSVPKESRSKKVSNDSSPIDEKHNWAPSKIVAATEPAGKRVRLN
ncbi:intramembrane protease 2 [Setomelanomma holmii]|uniref:Intramembrane protease 2 n=1 Tax=Setomelanomma holmii TaxID=210430 RepID=A0A9P4LQP1_9PLEO|nr:intramembrane protease 2 [Setomelanomma holmii]